MTFGNQALQAPALNMSIYLRRRDVGMAEHFLHTAQIRAVVDQMAGKSMTQNMGRESRRIEPRFERQHLQKLSAAPRRQVANAAARRE